MNVKRSLIKDIMNLEPDERDVRVDGWVRTRRDSAGGFSFIELSDGTCLKTLQIVADEKLANYKDEILKLTTGSSIRVLGKLVPSQGKGQKSEIQAHEVHVYSRAAEDYPLQKKRHSFEYLREIAHLRPRTNAIGAVMRMRNAVSFAIHKFFQERSFQYVHTPIISSSDTEGAGSLFHVTNFDLTDVPRTDNGEPDYARDFFHRAAYLTVSGQLQGEAYALALSNIYTFGPTFRAENSHTSRHLAEFWMVEPEMAFTDLDGDAELAQDFLKYIFNYVLENCPDDMELFDKFIDKGTIQRLREIAESDFDRITYTEAVEILLKSKKKFEFPVEWGHDLQSEHERFLTETHFKKPVIVTDYPAEIKAFYMKVNDNDKTVRAMDILVPKIGEIIGGSEREDRLDVLLERMKHHNLDSADYEWYLDLRRYGSVPHSGFGLGLERIIQFISGMGNIREVIPFPRFPGHADF